MTLCGDFGLRTNDRAVDSRAAAARADRVPGAAVARARVRARTGTRAAQKRRSARSRARAQAVATALHDRPRLFAAPADPIASFARERADGQLSAAVLAAAVRLAGNRADHRGPLAHDGAHLGDRSRRHGAGARRHAQAAAAGDAAGGFWAPRARDAGPPVRAGAGPADDDFTDDAAAQGAPRGRDVEGALAGILTTERRRTSDGKAVARQRGAPDLGRRPGARRRGRRGNRQRGAGASATARSSGCSTSCWRCC